MDQNAGTTRGMAAVSVPTLNVTSIGLVLIGVVFVPVWGLGP
ncbi:MAG: hypothetical protein V3T03_04550 [Candidatus Bipolaricaulota bacterium]